MEQFTTYEDLLRDPLIMLELPKIIAFFAWGFITPKRAYLRSVYELAVINADFLHVDT